MRLPVISLLATWALACGSAQTTPRMRLSTKEIVESSKPAIVRIESHFGTGADGEPKIGVGTGFVVEDDGLIATNLHVVRGTGNIRVTFLDGSKKKVQRVAAVDPDRDLVLLRVDADDLPALELGDSDGVSAGDHVIAIGNPLGVLDYTVSDGLISSVRLITEKLTVLQISAPISEGSSGGPLFNNYGEVIGVATMIAGAGQNLNFGVPSNYLRSLLDSEGDGYAPEQFASQFDLGVPSQLRPEGEEPTETEETVERRVPRHDVAVLRGCSDAELAAVFQGIGEAIETGAPLYNEGNHEACFRIYEGTALRYERELECKGIRDALGHGLLRARGKKSYTAKAWALRDAFDGILDVIMRKARQRP